MQVLDNLLYTPEHEWVRIDGDTAVIGITDYAQDSLGDVVYVELPEVGSTIEQGQAFGVVESVKAASDLFAPMTGEVIEVNSALDGEPETLNKEPFEGGWLIRIRVTNPDERATLLDADAYRALTTS